LPFLFQQVTLFSISFQELWPGQSTHFLHENAVFSIFVPADKKKYQMCRHHLKTSMIVAFVVIIAHKIDIQVSSK
jgi:hypothetical protein